MSRLAQELHRLFCSTPQPPECTQVCPQDSLDAQGRTKALVLQLAGADAWQQLGGLWRGLQTDLGLPAPAIAINGRDALQLWLSLAEPVALPEATAFLRALSRRWLPAARTERLLLHPATVARAAAPSAAPPAAAGGGSATAAASGGRGDDADGLALVAVPAQRPGEGDRWSAFVAPDLAPLFEDSPWLEGAPGDDAQASLLARITSISTPDWREACRRLGAGLALCEAGDEGPQAPAGPPPAADPGGHHTASAARAANPAVAATAATTGHGRVRPPGTCAHPRALRLLEAVVADAAAPLELRVQAAVALLPYGPGTADEPPAHDAGPPPAPRSAG